MMSEESGDVHDSQAPNRRKSRTGIKQPPIKTQSEEEKDLYEVDMSPRYESSAPVSVGKSTLESETSKPNSTISSTEPPRVAESEDSTSVAVPASPREAVTRVVTSFCDDAIATATMLASPRQENTARISAETESPNVTKPSPRDVVSQIAIDISDGAISSVVDKQILSARSSRSSENTTFDSRAKVQSSIEITEIKQSPSSPRDVVHSVARQAANVTDVAIETASVKLSSPSRPETDKKKQQPSQPKKGSAPAAGAGGTPKEKASQKKTSPRKGEKNRAEDSETRALSHAAASLDSKEKGEGLLESNGPGEKVGAPKKSSSRGVSSGPVPPPSEEKVKIPPSQGKNKKTKLLVSVISANDELPAIRRPSPPVQEKSPRQSGNPRNRKLKPGVTSPPLSPTGDSNNNGRLPPISSHPLRDPSRNGKKGVRSSENIGIRRESAEENKPKRRVGSQSAPMPIEEKLPPLRGSEREEGVSGEPIKKRKKPLFLRLEDRARKLQMQIDKEKMEMYHKIKQKRLKAQPTKEEIEAHMIRYEEMKQAHLEQEREFAEARKKDWRRKGGQLRKLGASPLRSNKLDFIEEQKLRAKEEEEQRRLRLEKGKEYGDAVRVGTEISSPRSPDKQHIIHSHMHDGSSRKQEGSPQHEGFLTPVLDKRGGPSVVVPELIPLPPGGFPRNGKNSAGKGPASSSNASIRDGIGNERFSPKSHHPDQHGGQHANKKASESGAAERRQLHPKRSLMSQSSVVDGALDSPYEGKVGMEWVSEVLDVDGEESKLAVIYETGFLMFMMEKGIIKSSDMFDDIMLTDGMVVATPPAKAKGGEVELFAAGSAPQGVDMS